MRLEVGGVERVFEPAVLVVIGYAGRDRAAVEAHIDELAELVVVMDGDETFVTLGSDHTDRVLEAVDVVASKGVCPKPVAPLDLVEAIPWAGQPPRCFVAFTGTVSVIGGIRPSARFQAALTGPGLGTVGFHYQTHVVPPLSAP